MEEQEEEKKEELTPKQIRTRRRGILAMIVIFLLFWVFVTWQKIEGVNRLIWFSIALIFIFFIAQVVSYAVSPDKKP